MIKKIIYKGVVQGSKEWQAFRETCTYNSSSIGDIMGCYCYKSPYVSIKAKFDQMKGIRPEPPGEFLRKIWNWGHMMEPIASNVLECHLPTILKTSSGEIDVAEVGTYRINFDDFSIGVSPDRIVMLKSTGVKFPVEIKCPYTPISRSDKSKLYRNPDGKLIVKPAHWIQVQCQIAAVGSSFGLYMCWTNKDWCVFHVERDDDFMGHMYEYLRGLKIHVLDKDDLIKFEKGKNNIFSVIKNIISERTEKTTSLLYHSPNEDSIKKI